MKAIPLAYYKYVRLILNFLAWISLGANNEILSPTLPDLSIRVGADYQVIGRTVGLRVLGSIFVPFCAGMLYDRFPRAREFGMGLIFTFAGILSMTIPYCTEVWSLTLILVAQGVSEGGLATAAQSMIIELFGTAAASALQFMHLGWAAGTFVANMVVRPFLAPNLKLSTKKIRYPCLEGLNVTSNETASNFDNSGSRIEYAYIIIGAYGICLGIMLFLFALLPKPKMQKENTNSNANPKRSIRDMIGPREISEGRPKFGILMLISLCLIYFTDVGAFVIFSRFLVTVAIDPCKDFTMTQAEATTLKSVVAGVVSAGRIVAGIIIGILFIKKIQPDYVILTSVIGMGLSYACFCFTALKYYWAFWTFSCLYAFFHAPIFGGCTPWFNQYIRVTSTVIAVAITGSSTGKLAFSWLAGYIFKAHSSQVFLYLDFSIVLVLVAVTISVSTISLRRGKRPSYGTDADRSPVRKVEVNESEMKNDQEKSTGQDKETMTKL